LELLELITLVRDLHFHQYVEFIEENEKTCAQCGPEVKLELSGENFLFGGLYAVDFLTNDGSVKFLEMHPDRIKCFAPIHVSDGDSLNVELKGLVWSDTIITIKDISYDPVSLKHNLEGFFDFWFDRNDLRYDEASRTGNIIHSLMLENRNISIDFGSSEIASVFALLDAIENSGIKEISIYSETAIRDCPELK